MSQFNTTELDFDQINTNIKNYFKRVDGPFKDFDFNGSGLNHLLDILAYNTHYNAVTSHMIMNESFLDSAQIRSNVVSRARLLGYTPLSATGSTASVDLIFSRASGSTATSYTLPKGTKFTTTIDDISYVFQTTTDTTSQLNTTANTFSFSSIEIKQGITKIQTFTVDNAYTKRYVITDKNIDTSTLVVKVYDSLAATSYDVYNKFESFNNLDSNSLVYFLSENTEGKYQLEFGNGTIGKQPLAAGKIEIEFLSVVGPTTNFANVFTYSETGVNVVDISSTTTVSPAAGGSNQESISSIKYNAPLAFISQDRAVTANDFKSLIKSNISGIQDVITWGGETEEIPDFGKVYLSVKPEGSLVLTDLQKTQVTNYLAGKKIISIEPILVDPSYTYILFTINFRFNPNTTNLTSGELSSKVRARLEKYSDDNLNNFDGIYRHSNLVSSLDQTDSAILSTTIDTNVYKTITLGSESTYAETINFNLQLSGTVDQTSPMMSTTSFTRGGVACSLEDEPISGDTEKRNIFIKRTSATGIVRVKNDVGFLYPSTGKIELSGIEPDADSVINITVTPNDKDIFTEKRNILIVDLDNSVITGIVDSSGRDASGGTATTTTTTGGVSYSTGY